MQKQYITCHTVILKLTIILIVLINYAAFGQTLIGINNSAYKLKADDSTSGPDLYFLKTEVRNKNIIGIGEASHGTKEFYMQKSRIIDYLINNCDFKTVAFEAPSSTIASINLFIQTGEGNLKASMRSMGLYNTKEIYNLFQIMRQYNVRHLSKMVNLIGLDHQDYWANPITRDKFMAENLIKNYQKEKRKIIVWSHNVHIMKDTTSNLMSMGSYLNQYFKNEFYTMGFDSFKGSVNVLNSGNFETHNFQAEKNSLSSIFAQAKYEAFFLPFKRKTDLYANGQLIINFYSNWREPVPLKIKPGIDFDSIVFIRNTSASTKLD